MYGADPAPVLWSDSQDQVGGPDVREYLALHVTIAGATPWIWLMALAVYFPTRAMTSSRPGCIDPRGRALADRS